MKRIASHFILAVALSVSCTSVIAEEPDFEKHKQEAIAHIGEKIQKLNEHKACISAANEKEALKACQEKMKAWHQAEQTERMEKQKGRIDERINKLQQKKSELEKKDRAK